MAVTINLTSLDVQDSDEKLERASGAGRPSIDNPFGPVIRDSFDKGKKDKDNKTMGMTKVIRVLADDDRGKSGEPVNVVTIKGLLRRAADDQGLGVRIVTTDETVTETVPTPVRGEDDEPILGEDDEPVMQETETERLYVTIKFAAKDKTERTRTAKPAESATESADENGDENGETGDDENGVENGVETASVTVETPDETADVTNDVPDAGVSKPRGRRR